MELKPATVHDNEFKVLLNNYYKLEEMTANSKNESFFSRKIISSKTNQPGPECVSNLCLVLSNIRIFLQ